MRRGHVYRVHPARAPLAAVSPWVITGVAALVAVGACARILGFRPPGARPFEHRAHVIEGIACVECHAGIEQSRNRADDALHLPDRDKCVSCHAEPHDPRPCMGCHGTPYTAADLLQVRKHLRFDHATHREASRGQCVRCHAAVAHGDGGLRPTMGVCLGCHQHADQFRVRDCDGCHVDLPAELTRPESHLVHDGDFVREHGVRAASSADLCATCHKDRFCAQCHGATVPALPWRLAPAQTLAASVHRAGFRARHAEEARGQPGLCVTCHAPDSCGSCHIQVGVGAQDPRKGSPHPVGWVGVVRNDHGPAARRDPAGCAACHSGAGELLCVSCHRVGGVGGNPHPPGWSSGRRLSERPCRLCHLGLSE